MAGHAQILGERVYVREVTFYAGVAPRVRTRPSPESPMPSLESVVASSEHLIDQVTRRYTPTAGWSREDMQQVGRLAILRAFNLWDPERGEWESFARVVVRSDVRRDMERHSRGVRPAHSLWSKPDRLAECPVVVGDLDAAATVAVDGPTPLPTAIQQAMVRLDPLTARVVCVRYGLDGNGIRTLEDTASIVGCSVWRVRVLEKTGLRQLRRELGR